MGNEHITRSTVTEIVHSTAAGLRLLTPDGRLIPLDSLTAVDFVSRLERTLGFELSVQEFTPKTFQSIESLVEAIASMSPG